TAALRREPIEIYGDGTQIREFTFVDDIVDANILAATRELPPATVLNVSGGEEATLNECLETIESIAGRAFERQERPPMPGDVFRTGATGERARSLLGWRPRVYMREG